jgi:NAD(P)H-dependent flavin oxidoreductase YrpB (nitropropane dioxygenase family)
MSKLHVGRRQVLSLIGGATLLGACGSPEEEEELLGTTSDELRGARPIRTRLTEQYDITHPITNAAMGFVALPELAAAVSNAGGLGFIGASPEPPPVVAARIAAVQAATSNPFGVGFIIASSPLGEFVTADHIAICAAARVPVVSFHWGIPPVAWVNQLHAAGTKVWVQAHSVQYARQAVAAGADAIIAQGVQAGGHNRNDGLPTNILSGLIQHAIPRNKLVLAAGGVANGLNLAKALLLGADGAWVGTRFVASTECYANQGFKQRIVAGGIGATIVQNRFGPEWPDQPQRVLKVRATTEPLRTTPAQIGSTLLFPGVVNAPYPMPKYSAIVPTRDTTGDLEEMDMPAGSESTIIVRDIKPAAAIINEMSSVASVLLG